MNAPFNERGVVVTRTTLSAGGQVVALREVRDLRIVAGRKNRIVPLVISLVGLVAAIVGGYLASTVTVVCGVMLVVVGWLTWKTQEVVHRLVAVTADGEREMLASPELAFVERVAAVVRAAQEPQTPAA